MQFCRFAAVMKASSLSEKVHIMPCHTFPTQHILRGNDAPSSHMLRSRQS